MFKTHVDAFDSWDASIAQKLQELAVKHCEPVRPDFHNFVANVTAEVCFKPDIDDTFLRSRLIGRTGLNINPIVMLG